MNNFFTVIVPNLNHGEYLSNCLNSILKQNYKKFEIIILDGGSIDHSLKIIKNFAKKNKSITYWHSKKDDGCLLYTSPSPRDAHESRMPSSA